MATSVEDDILPIASAREIIRRRPADPSVPLARRCLSSLVVSAVVSDWRYCLPLAYLALRAAGAGDEIWRLLLRPRSAIILFNSVALCLCRNPEHHRNRRTVWPGWSYPQRFAPGGSSGPGLLIVVPLAVPSYVGGFVLIGALGPRGMLQRCARAARCRTPAGNLRLSPALGWR